MPITFNPLSREIEEKRKQIAELEAQLATAKGDLAGLEHAVELLNAKGPGATFSPFHTAGQPPSAPAAVRGRRRRSELRPGTDMAKCADALEQAGHPLYVDDLLAALGKEPTRNNRASLSGSLAALVRNKRVFTRPEPNTFGLIGMTPTQDSQAELLPVN